MDPRTSGETSRWEAWGGTVQVSSTRGDGGQRGRGSALNNSAGGPQNRSRENLVRVRPQGEGRERQKGRGGKQGRELGVKGGTGPKSQTPTRTQFVVEKEGTQPPQDKIQRVDKKGEGHNLPRTGEPTKGGGSKKKN